MKILADENTDPEMIGWLRSEGQEVLSVREVLRGASDSDVLALASRSGCVLLTLDKHFGELVVRQRRPVAGVILLRFRTESRAEFLDLFKRFWPALSERALGRIVIATNRTVRSRRLTTEQQ